MPVMMQQRAPSDMRVQLLGATWLAGETRVQVLGKSRKNNLSDAAGISECVCVCVRSLPRVPNCNNQVCIAPAPAFRAHGVDPWYLSTC